MVLWHTVGEPGGVRPQFTEQFHSEREDPYPHRARGKRQVESGRAVPRRVSGAETVQGANPAGSLPARGPPPSRRGPPDRHSPPDARLVRPISATGALTPRSPAKNRHVPSVAPTRHSDPRCSKKIPGPPGVSTK